MNQQNNLSVPVAIVIAGGLVALAIYFGGGTKGGDVGEIDNGEVVGAVPEVEVSVGEMRPVTQNDHIRGSASAKVTVVEYSDLECPFCKRFHPTMEQLIEEYPNDVRWVYRHFPLEGLHSKAKKEAEATECAGEQGKFWEMVDKIFEVTPSNDGLDLDDLPRLASEVGVANIAQFEECLESGKYKQYVEDDLADAESAGGRGTPYSVIIGPDGDKVPLSGAQPYAAVKQAVDQMLTQ